MVPTNEDTSKIGRLLIRADASSKIGTGHIMRCLALAEAWQNRGGTTIFFSYCESKGLRSRIIDEGFTFIPIKKPHPDPFDLKVTLDILQQLTKKNSSLLTRHSSLMIPWLVLDGYHFDTSYQKAIKEMQYRLLVIDDMGHLPYYHADILLNQNINAEKLSYHCDCNTKLLLGSHYVLLRREFLRWGDRAGKIRDFAKKVLVTLGGADPGNVTLKIINALKILNILDLELKVIVGSANPNTKSIADAMLSTSCKNELLQSVNNMPELMAWADVVISGGGSTCWELAFMGLPTIVLVLGENQLSVADDLGKKGFAINLGWHNTISVVKIAEEFQKLLYDKEKRLKLSQEARKMVDGNGASRVTEFVSKISTI